MTCSLLGMGTFFQLGYVTNDLDAALADCVKRLGVRDFLKVDVGTAAGEAAPHGAHIGMAWTGSVMIEIIQPIGNPAPVYVDDLEPPGPLALAFNHVGLTVPDDEGWEQLLATADEQGLKVAWRGSAPDRIDVAYIDTRSALGHYCEFIKINNIISDLMARVPRN